MGRKHCGKGDIAHYDLYSRHVKTRTCLGKGLNGLSTETRLKTALKTMQSINHILIDKIQFAFDISLTVIIDFEKPPSFVPPSDFFIYRLAWPIRY